MIITQYIYIYIQVGSGFQDMGGYCNIYYMQNENIDII